MTLLFLFYYFPIIFYSYPIPTLSVSYFISLPFYILFHSYPIAAILLYPYSILSLSCSILILFYPCLILLLSHSNQVNSNTSPQVATTV